MKIFNSLKKHSNRIGAAVVVAVSSVATASAALPAIIGTTLTGIQTDALALVDLIWPVVGAVFTGFLLIKLFKRAGNKV